MAYDKEQIFKDAKRLARDENLFFMADIIAYLPISESSFYSYFPAGSEELEALRKILDENKIHSKTKQRKKWEDSDNATLQLALYRLTATADEHRALNQHYIDHTTQGEKITATPLQNIRTALNLDDETDEETNKGD